MSNIRIIKPYSRTQTTDITLSGALAREGRTKAPGTSYGVTPALDAKKNVITGIDENALSLFKIEDKATRDIEIARLKSIREKLEAELNESLSPTSAFWTDPDEGMVNVPYYLKDGENVFDLNNPIHAVNYYWLSQLPIIAPSLEEVESGKLDPSTIAFYIYETDVQVSKDFQRKKKINEVVAILNGLGPVEIKKVAFLLNMKMPEKSTYEEIYNVIDTFLHQDKKFGTSDPIKEFERVAGYTPEILNIKLLIKQLLDERILRTSGNSIMEASNVVAKSMEDFELKLAEDPELYILYDEKMKAKKAYVDNI